MTNPIGGLDQFAPLLRGGVVGGSAQGAPSSAKFEEMLGRMINGPNELQNRADKAIEQHQIGGDVSKPEVFVAIRKAELALRMTIQIRNQVLEAYDEVRQMRM